MEILQKAHAPMDQAPVHNKPPFSLWTHSAADHHPASLTPSPDHRKYSHPQIQDYTFRFHFPLKILTTVPDNRSHPLLIPDLHPPARSETQEAQRPTDNLNRSLHDL